MLRAMNSAIAGLKAHQTEMDVIGNNIANVNTWGYKSKSANFADAMYENYLSAAAGKVQQGQTGGVNASQIGYGSSVNSITANFGNGSQNATGNDMDCMIDGPGFFIVGGYNETVDPEDIAAGGLSLSRVGIFQTDNNGYLLDDSGNYVYGYTEFDEDGNPAEGAQLTPIRVTHDPNGEGADIVNKSITIGRDGKVVVIDDQKVAHTVGQIALATVGNVNGLEQSGGYLYGIGENAGEVTVGLAGTASGTILSGFLEQSNVDLATEMAKMITAQRGYQANSKMITVSDEMLETLVNMKR